MRVLLGLSAAMALAMLSAPAFCQQGANESPKTSTTEQATQPPATQDGSPDASLAAAARKAREMKKSAKPAKVYTNDNIPTSGGVSSPAASQPVEATTNASASTPSSAGKDEKSWRDRFAKLHEKLDRDKQNLDVMQRELSVLDLQYYNDPVKAMQQQYSREDINKKTADIDLKKKEIDADQQAIDDAEEELRKAGGDPGWAR